jgi:Spy/CpxP family protein refolding chaperone
MTRIIGKGRVMCLTLTLVALASSTPAEAQRRPGSGRGGMQDREQLEQRIRARMGEMMRQRLDLTPEQGERLSEVVKEFDGQRRELGRQAQATRRRVEALILEGGQDDEEGLELLGRLSEIKLREAELFGVEQEALLEVLSPVQVLQFQALREQLGQRIRRLRGNRRGNVEGPRGSLRL